MKWISVDERLPDSSKWLLVYQDGAINCMGFSPDTGFEDWTYNKSGCHNIVIELITHWMVLPEGPESERMTND